MSFFILPPSAFILPVPVSSESRASNQPQSNRNAQKTAAQERGPKHGTITALREAISSDCDFHECGQQKQQADNQSCQSDGASEPNANQMIDIVRPPPSRPPWYRTRWPRHGYGRRRVQASRSARLVKEIGNTRGV
jgi:hypothetical protein